MKSSILFSKRRRVYYYIIHVFFTFILDTNNFFSLFPRLQFSLGAFVLFSAFFNLFPSWIIVTGFFIKNATATAAQKQGQSETKYRAVAMREKGTPVKTLSDTSGYVRWLNKKVGCVLHTCTSRVIRLNHTKKCRSHIPYPLMEKWNQFLIENDASLIFLPATNECKKKLYQNTPKKQRK